MKEAIFCQMDEAGNNIFDELEDLLFLDSFTLLEVLAQISIIAVFSDDVAVRGFADDIKTFENIGVFQLGKGLDLAIQHFSADSVLDALHVDGLNCDGLVWIIEEVLLNSLVPLQTTEE